MMNMSFSRSEGERLVPIRAESQPLYHNPPWVIQDPDPEYSSGTRRLQGIPSLAHSPGGRLWALTTNNPNDEDPEWSASRRLTNAVMVGKPIVISSGEWVLPASTWRETDDSAKVVVSTDGG